ncbi:hypothetical protein COOONC_00752 [Cooperia oncophora]
MLLRRLCQPCLPVLFDHLVLVELLVRLQHFWPPLKRQETQYECLDIACLCGFFGGSGGANCVLPNGQRLTRGLRKEYRVLTDAERQR